MSSYPTIIWDCDGVVLNSNKIKTNAFCAVTLPFGEAASRALRDFHILNGGISRYKKFEHFVDSILPVHAPNVIVDDKTTFLSGLLSEYAAKVKSGLLNCEIAPRLEELRQSLIDSNWLIVSGGDQTELRELFDLRGIAQYFNGGIYGSPKDKHNIVEDLLKSKQIQLPGLFLGDSRLDYEVANAFGFDFIFVSQWSELPDWSTYCQSMGIQSIASSIDILDLKIFQK